MGGSPDSRDAVASRLVGIFLLTGLLGTVLVGVAAWLFLPRPSGEADLGRAVSVSLVDASASVRRTRPDWLPWVRRTLAEEAHAALEKGELFAVVSFGAGVGTSFAPAEPEGFLDRLEGRRGAPFDPLRLIGSDDETSLAQALEVATRHATGVGSRPGRIALLGDREFTGADPLAPLARLTRRGAEFVVRSPPPPALAELALRELRFPRSLEGGAPLAGSARLAYAPGSVPVLDAFLDLELESEGFVVDVRVPLDLPPEGGDFDVPLALGPVGFGRTEIRGRARLVPGPDPVPENDTARIAVRVAGELVVGVVVDPEREREVRAWLTPSGTSGLPGLSFVFVDRAELSTALSGLDALVSFDLPTRALPELLIEDFVRRGGGWLATSGWRFLEDWVPGEARVGLADLLPLEPAPLEHGPRDVVLLVDGSGSMQGEPFDTVRAAALDLVAAALPSDEVSLRFFTGRLEEERLVKPRATSGDEDAEGARGAAQRLLGLRVPTGETHILLSLEQFASERESSERDSLALLLTDGHEREAMPDPAGRAERVLDRFDSASATLRVIAVGQDADLGFLALLTKPGEEVLQPTGLDELAEVFRRELTGAQWRAGEELPVHWASLGNEAGQGLVAELRAGSPAALPTLERYVKNRLRPGGTVLWVGEEEEPVLAAQRVGRGRTALFSSLPGGGWGPDYVKRGPGEPAPFANLLRWLARGPDRRAEDGVQARVEDGHLILDGLAPEASALLEVRLLDGSQREPVELGRIELTPPLERYGGDPMTRREGRLAPELRRRARTVDTLLWIDGPADGEPLLVPLRLRLTPELQGTSKRLPDALEERLPQKEEEGDGRAIPGRAPRKAAFLLACGLMLLFGSALGWGGHQGIGLADR